MRARRANDVRDELLKFKFRKIEKQPVRFALPLKVVVERDDVRERLAEL